MMDAIVSLKIGELYVHSRWFSSKLGIRVGKRKNHERQLPGKKTALAGILRIIVALNPCHNENIP